MDISPDATKSIAHILTHLKDLHGYGEVSGALGGFLHMTGHATHGLGGRQEQQEGHVMTQLHDLHVVHTVTHSLVLTDA